MWNRWRHLFKRKVCYLCGRKVSKAQSYYNDKGEQVLICPNCTGYAERRALVKIN